MHAPERAMVRLLGQAKKTPNDSELFSGLVQAARYCALLEESLRAHQRAHAGSDGGDERGAHVFPGRRLWADDRVVPARQPLLSRCCRPGGQGPGYGGIRTAAPSRFPHAACSIAAVHSGRGSCGKYRGGEERSRFGARSGAGSQYYLARHLARGGAEEEGLARLPDFDGVKQAVCRCEAKARPAFQAADGDRILAAVANTE